MKCKNCGKEIDGSGKMFCCLSCSSIFNGKKIHKKLVDTYNSNPNICKQCGSKILHTGNNKNNLAETKNKIFCNTSCAAIYNNNKGEHRKCKWCGGINKRKSALYCSDKCLQEKQDKDTELKLIENGTIRLKGIKNFLIRKRGHKCETCGITEWNGIYAPIELHHINGDSTDNREENLKLICPNCHSQTDNYKSKNKNSKRKR